MFTRSVGPLSHVPLVPPINAVFTRGAQNRLPPLESAVPLPDPSKSGEPRSPPWPLRPGPGPLRPS
eukprot:7108944-Prymnesium_polylepis.1